MGLEVKSMGDILTDEEEQLLNSECTYVGESHEIDIIIFSLVNKIETLLWILELETREKDLLEQLYPVEH